VALVSASLARKFWPDRDAIGQRFRLDPDGPLITVVGTTGDVARHWIMGRQAPTVYRPFEQVPPGDVALVLRVAGDPVTVAPLVRASVAAVDPEQPVAQLRSYPQVVADATFGLRFAAETLAVMAGVALLVSLVGVYSLVAYIASQRTREMGVRAALGATAWDITRLTVGQGGRIALGGLIAGVLLAFAVGKLLESMLFGVVSADYVLTGIIGVVLAATAIAASYVPARRAARVDPVEALRVD
jgi:putative ABC transport system permease protein